MENSWVDFRPGISIGSPARVWGEGGSKFDQSRAVSIRPNVPFCRSVESRPRSYISTKRSWLFFDRHSLFKNPAALSHISVLVQSHFSYIRINGRIVQKIIHRRQRVEDTPQSPMLARGSGKNTDRMEKYLGGFRQYLQRAGRLCATRRLTFSFRAHANHLHPHWAAWSAFHQH